MSNVYAGCASATMGERPAKNVMLPADWRTRAIAILPESVKEDWLDDAPEEPELFILILTLYEEGAKPENRKKCGVSYPRGIEWFDSITEAEERESQLRKEHGEYTFLACMPDYTPEQSYRDCLLPPL